MSGGTCDPVPGRGTGGGRIPTEVVDPVGTVSIRVEGHQGVAFRQRNFAHAGTVHGWRGLHAAGGTSSECEQVQRTEYAAQDESDQVLTGGTHKR